MWPAIVTGSIAFITLLGFIQQRNPDFYRKIENVLYWGTTLISWSCAAFIIGHNEGIDKIEKLAGTSIDPTILSNTKYNDGLVGVAILAPMIVLIATSIIGHISDQIKEEKKI